MGATLLLGSLGAQLGSSAHAHTQAHLGNHVLHTAGVEVLAHVQRELPPAMQAVRQQARGRGQTSNQRIGEARLRAIASDTHTNIRRVHAVLVMAFAVLHSQVNHGSRCAATNTNRSLQDIDSCKLGLQARPPVGRVAPVHLQDASQGLLQVLGPVGGVGWEWDGWQWRGGYA